MKKRLQLFLCDESWAAANAVVELANRDFELGNISLSDAINEMLLSSKVDIKALQLKHTNLRKTLRVIAAKKEIDVDAIIKSLQEIKSRGSKRNVKSAHESEQTND